MTMKHGRNGHSTVRVREKELDVKSLCGYIRGMKIAKNATPAQPNTLARKNVLLDPSPRCPDTLLRDTMWVSSEEDQHFREWLAHVETGRIGSSVKPD
jgi:hypothetical protein